VTRRSHERFTTGRSNPEARTQQLAESDVLLTVVGLDGPQRVGQCLRVRTLLEQQYAALADWLDEVPINDHLTVPVGLGDWTVRELVAHLGLGIGLSRYVAAAEPGAVPLSLGDYVRAYPPASDQIAEMTREMSARFGDDLVGGFRRTAAGAFEAIDAIRGEVFQARRGPIARDDYLLTRLLELVVHGDDLQRALGRTDAPLLPGSVTVVADALAAAYEQRAGVPTSDGAGLEWIRRAAGRVPDDDPHLPLL
jgi:uncharacterized protein (TIGR03083 family)